MSVEIINFKQQARKKQLGNLLGQLSAMTPSEEKPKFKDEEANRRLSQHLLKRKEIL